jgi:hypothetical protein
MTTTPLFDYPALLARFDDLEAFRVRYADDETGWAKRVDATHVILCNVPLTEGLCYLDICTTSQKRRSRLPTIDRVVQRRYTQYALVRYTMLDDLESAESKARYVRFSNAIDALGCAAEGMYPGFTLVNAPKGCALKEVIRSAADLVGITLEEVVVKGEVERGA